MSEKKAAGGLQGVVAGQSAISTVGVGGIGLNYRGYDINDLAYKCSFEEVTYLLLKGHLPNKQQLDELRTLISQKRQIPCKLKQILETLPKESHPMDIMRTVASLVGILEPESKPGQEYEISIRLISLFGPALLYWHHYSNSGIKINENTGKDSIAENFLKLYHLKSQIDPLVVKTFDVSLILYAEHDFAASTFAARVTVSTLSDFYSGITTAIGTLRGPLHGGANEAAMQYLEPLRSIQQADQFLNSRYQSKQLIMGFGHRVYKKEDPRSPIIKDFSLQLSKTANGDPTLLAVSQHIEKRMIEEKKIYPNLDFYSASAYKQCGVPTPMFTAIFVISRMTGWGGHIIEQRSNNKLMRPVSDYTGPAKKQFVPIDMRNKANL
ncbi:unnamed protein product [Paramecium octaurelia]|uniref:Citrate synthase n=1 Tax=Paramecium octaurelia TaxID=43137 RepID=A0A8S1VMN9_PAROT|nr:unnamed protein product [Paramecium octaurelia]